MPPSYIPSVPSAPITGSGTGNTLKNKQQKDTLMHIPMWLLVLRYASLIVFFGAIIGGVLFRIATHETPSYLQNIGIITTGSEHKTLQKEKNTLQAQAQQAQKQVDTWVSLSNQGIYTDEQPVLQAIETKQTQWFSDANPAQDGAWQFGRLSSPLSAAAYISSGAYPNLSLRNMSTISIQRMRFTPYNTQIDITAEHIFGKVFALASEFNALMNTLPHTKEGQIGNFRRQTSPLGDEYTRVSLEFMIDNKTDPLGLAAEQLRSFITQEQ